MKKGPLLLLCLVLFLLIAAHLPSPASTAESWADNFDGYATGANMHGRGGWKGFSNDPGYTAYTTDLRARSAPNAVDVYGNTDLVHEYTATSGLYRYRFFQYIPSTTIGTSYFIMLNQYDDAGVALNWSVQVAHSGLNGLIVDDGSGSTTPIVRNQWVEVCLEIDLDHDAQAYYYNGQLLYSGTWTEHISGAGITSIAAVSLFANGSGSVFYDDMSLAPGDCATVFYDLYLPAVLRD